jgi:hypothetical protein
VPPPSPTRCISVCIVNWNTRDDLLACLTALRDHPHVAGEQEVIVVDNASEDGSAPSVQADWPDVRLIANPANENYAHGTNQALSAATGDALLLLNPDARVTAGALNALAAALDAEPAVAAVAAKLIFDDGIVQSSVRGFPTPAAVLWDILGLARLFPKSRRFAAYRMPWFDYQQPGIAPQPMASCLLLRRSALDAIGPMDERFALFFNDVDWCLRAYADGWKIVYAPDAVIVHGHGGTTRRVRKAAVWESHRALLRLWAKHYKETTPTPFYVLMVAIVTLGAWARTGCWGKSLGRDGGEAAPADLHLELERAG